MRGKSVDELQESFDPARVANALHPVVTTRFGQGVTIDSVSTEHLAKAVFTCTLRLVNGAGGLPIVWSVIAKAFGDEERLIRDFNLTEALWLRGFGRDAADGLSVPEPLLAAKELGLFFMEQIGGQKLRHLVKRAGGNCDYMRQFARMLAKLHRCPVPLDRTFSMEAQLRRRTQEHAELCDAFPAQGASIRMLVDGIPRVVRPWSCEFQHPVHGDYNLGQLHVGAERTWLLDFGNLRLGDPALDVGNVLALSLLNEDKAGISNGEELLAAFTGEYSSAMGSAVLRRAPGYQAYYLLCRAHKYLRSPEAARRRLVPALIERAVVCLETSA
jgi:hypothetical protein